MAGLYLRFVLDKLTEILDNCNRCAVLTGAGISAESGVPTFRGKEGLWGKFKPEELATMEAFVANPKIVWEWYSWRRQLLKEVKPNNGHYALVDMAAQFDEFTLITQNVDGLHQQSGSTQVLELHGNILCNKCIDCSLPFDPERTIDPDNIPICPKCGGKIRPDIVWFGEMLDPEIIDAAFLKAERAELFFTVGTSALVHPAASLPIIAKQHGATLVEVNPEETPLTDLADFSFRSPSGEFLPLLMEKLKARQLAQSS